MKKQNTLLFIPGFKGSSLVDQEGQLVWPTFIAAQLDHKTSLRNHVPEIDSVNSRRFKSSGVIEDISIIPGLYKINIYAKFFQAFKRCSPEDTELIPFHYDWRQDLMMVVPRLKSLIERLKKEKRGTIDIVCHSMGGLITSYVLQMFDEPVLRHVYFVAVPFQGTLKALLDLIQGSSFGLNKTLLSSKAMASFASIYYLLPRYPAATPNYSLLDIETWKQFNLGYLMAEQSPEKAAFLQRQLMRVARFYQRLEESGPTAGALKIINLSNRTHNTPYQILLEQNQQVIQGQGDGSVPDVSLELPSYFSHLPQDRHHIDEAHALSFNDEKLLKRILLQ
ncbi:lipase/acyltransferase domain-containing protein [Legionella yabuuchiae]|uniref:lipase/acyltransferase domain-containing protein n=1 Tax=Legionella yabuuchiae TaxID=376727 RepID=UPI0013EFC0E5|nr:alpha/beta hydrolase [Legionella yabuuchiae]